MIFRVIFSSKNVSRYLYAMCGTFLTGPYVPHVCLCVCLWLWGCPIYSFLSAAKSALTHKRPVRNCNQTHISATYIKWKYGHAWPQAHVTSCVHSRVHAIKYTRTRRFRMRETVCLVWCTVTHIHPQSITSQPSFPEFSSVHAYLPTWFTLGSLAVSLSMNKCPDLGWIDFDRHRQTAAFPVCLSLAQ